MHEFPVQFVDFLRMLEHNLGNECAGLDVATTLELEQVSFGANDGASS